MNKHMPLPSQEVARQLLTSVPYANRLLVGRLVMPVGLQQSYVRELRELHTLLAPDERCLPAISLPALATWVERIVGDADLSEALRQVARDAPSYVDFCAQAYERIGDRLAQAREVAGFGNV